MIKNVIPSIRLFSVEYLLPRPLVIQRKEVAENPILLQTFDLKRKFIILERTLINKLWSIVVYKVLKSLTGLNIIF